MLYDVLWSLSVKFKFHLIPESKILNDLVIARIAFPSSKFEAFEFIHDLFGIKNRRTTFYHQLEAGNLKKWQEESRARITSVAKKHFDFNFSLVFYDLTTLYFESFETDELRRIGFSKDNKSANPQVMIGLLVNDLGFPIFYQLFAGNKKAITQIVAISQMRKSSVITRIFGTLSKPSASQNLTLKQDPSSTSTNQP